MKLWLLILAILFAWYLLSQLIMWMLKPKNDDEAVELWFAVFIAPVAVVYVLLDMAQDKLLRLIRLMFPIQ